MHPIPTTQTALRKIRERAKQIRDQHASLGHARDAASQEAGYDSYHHALKCLASNGPSEPDLLEGMGWGAAELMQQVQDFIKAPSSEGAYKQAMEAVYRMYAFEPKPGAPRRALAAGRAFLNEVLIFAPEIARVVHMFLGAYLDFPEHHEEFGFSAQTFVLRLDAKTTDPLEFALTSNAADRIRQAVRVHLPSASVLVDTHAFALGEVVADDPVLVLIEELISRGTALRYRAGGCQVSKVSSAPPEPLRAPRRTDPMVMVHVRSDSVGHEHIIEAIHALRNQLQSGAVVPLDVQAGRRHLLDIAEPSEALAWTQESDLEVLDERLDAFPRARPAVIARSPAEHDLGLLHPNGRMTTFASADPVAPVSAYLSLAGALPGLTLVNTNPLTPEMSKLLEVTQFDASLKFELPAD